MKFDPNITLKGIDGKPLTGHPDQIHAGKILAHALFYDTENKDNQLKFNTWAMDLYAMKSIEIDDQDKNLLLSFIKRFPPVTYVPLYNLLAKQ